MRKQFDAPNVKARIAKQACLQVDKAGPDRDPASSGPTFSLLRFQ
jgi:hypothetical protein